MVLPIWRELYVMTCMTGQHIATGITLGFPAILSPAVAGNGTDLHLNREQVSWIAAAYSMTGTVGYLIIPPFMQLFGRRFINLFFNVFTIIGSIIIACAGDAITLMIGRSFQGMGFCGMFITSITIAEYCHPKRRATYIIMKLIFLFTGIIMCHGLSFVISWRNIAWLSVVPAVLGAVTSITWPDSPSWLAYKGRFEHSIEAFHWLRGNNPEARKEIRELISAHRSNPKIQTTNFFKSILKALCSKEFLKPLCISMILVVMLHASGIHFMMAYVIEIMVLLSGDKSKAFYYTIGFDAMKITAAFMSVVVTRIFKRRVLFFSAGAISSVLLSSICVLNYLNDRHMIRVEWLTPLVLILFNFVCNLGTIPLIVVLKGEIFPIEFKGIGPSVVGVLNALVSVIALKLTSNMLTIWKVHGTFLVYNIVIVCCLIILYFILPETKDRTLHDIETDFKDQKMPPVDKYDDVEITNMMKKI